jgi:hypothetical protein
MKYAVDSLPTWLTRQPLGHAQHSLELPHESSGYREADVGRCALRQQTICTRYAGRHLSAMTFVDKFIYTVVCVVSLKTWVHNLFRVMGGVTAVVF